ncbi:MAG: hypothetical protein KF849_06550 [Rhizobiaceae bacterium]|nr:hypothetical protein [Rhizobiaceae bacterium]
MDFDLSSDQSVLAEAIDNLVGRHHTLPSVIAAHYLPGDGLDSDLAQAGFFDIARSEGMSALEAVLLVERVARAPVAVEIGASALVVPLALPDHEISRPVALADARAGSPVRFLPGASSLLVDAGSEIRIADVSRLNIEPISSTFAYPFGTLTSAILDASEPLGDVSVELLRQWRRVALATEICGAGKSALDLTVQYVKDRRQFGRPIGEFQSVQHRLAECTMLLASARMMALRAALTGNSLDAAEAASLAQEAGTRIHHETHQFHGAMGITMEYPLHLWTYRLKALQGEMGGLVAQTGAVAALRWDDGEQP